MTDEERQKTMDYILEQQAQFTVEIQKLQEAHVLAEKRASRGEKRLARFEEIAARFAESTDTRINALIGAQEHLTVLVERYIEGRNGTS